MKTIKTKLKFVKSDRTGAWVGFVSKNTKTGYIKGVRQDSEEPKVVCVVAHDISSTIKENMLYDVDMIPMKAPKKGYIVISAVHHDFTARISSTVVKNAVYVVEVKFGNKTIIYDPLDGRLDSVRTIDGVVEILNARKDIKNLPKVIEDFKLAAQNVLAAYENDGHYGKYKTQTKA